MNLRGILLIRMGKGFRIVILDLWRFNIVSVLKIIEWNINGRSGYNPAYAIPPFITNVIAEQNAHIIVLTELFITAGWHHLRSFLEENYKIFTSPYISEQNSVLIGIKKDIEDFDYGSLKTTTQMNGNCKDDPNFLQISANYNKKPFTIIGTRIRVGDGGEEDLLARKKQRESIYTHINSLENITQLICIGDFNATPRFLWITESLTGYLDLKSKGFELACPSYNTINNTYHRVNKEYSCWSFVHKDGVGIDKGKTSIDNIISKGVYLDNLDYIWSFVNQNNGYGYLKPEDYKSDLFLPDHAILTATITF